MIKIKRFKHIFGIKKLINSELIENDTIIYSPNGVMKTSFSDGLNCIMKGEDCSDVVNKNNHASYEIEENGTTITEKTVEKKLNLIIFKGEDLSSEIYENPEIARLVMSKDLKKLYNSKKKEFDNIEQKIKDIISRKVLNGKANKVDEVISGFSEKSDCLNFLLDPMFDSWEESIFKNDCSSINYLDVVNDKIESVFNDVNLAKEFKNYRDFIEKQCKANIFNDKFTVLELEKLVKSAEKLGFFDAGHKLFLHNISKEKNEDNIENNLYGREKLQILIEKEKNEFYKSDESLTIISNIKKDLDKNKSTKKFASIIESTPWIIAEIKNFEDMKRRLFFTKLIDSKEEFLKAREEAKKINEALNKIIENANKEENLLKWEKVLKKYNSRFICRNFDLKIVNKTEAIVGKEPPIIKKYWRNVGENVEVDENNVKRFSTGEKRALYILNLIFEIELRREQNTPFTVILDDIADSFDYKNKYAIIEYIRDLHQIDNIQLIILTHNFDFYRSCRQCIGVRTEPVTALVGYKKNNGVKLQLLSNDIYKTLASFNNWKDGNHVANVIAYLPLLRNLTLIIDRKEKTTNNDRTDYTRLCDFLHYNDSIDKLKFSSIQDILEKFDFKNINLFINKLYIKTLNSKVDEIIDKGTDETDLKSKIILSIYIRLKTDKIIKTLYSKNLGKNVIDSENNKEAGRLSSHKMFNEVKSIIDPKLAAIIETSFVISPSFIHLNSFMYEPLVDVGVDNLISNVKKLKEINDN